MKFYDVIIVGGGIAGTACAFNLKRKGFKGKTLLIEESKIGSNSSFYHRNTSKRIIKKYNIPYENKFKGIYFKFNSGKIKHKKNYYFINYVKTCNYFLNNSNTKTVKENAIDVNNNIIITNKNSYEFRYLIDATGNKFFIRKKFNLPLPFKFWIGEIKEYSNKKINLDDYCYFLLRRNGNLEDVYHYSKKTLKGDWTYTDTIKKLDKFKPDQKLDKKFDLNNDYQSYSKAAIPCAFALPLVYKNIAFIGDSFGNATTTAAEGVRPILDSSEILVDAIIENNLIRYEEEWMKKNYKSYINKLILKSNPELKIKMLEKIQHDKQLVSDIFSNKKIDMKKITIKSCSIKDLTKLIRETLKIKIKYRKMKKSIKQK